jgi:hypothetical protein
MAQLLVDAPISVSTLMLLETLPDESFEGFPFYLSVRSSTTEIFVVAGSGWLEDFASLPDRAELAPVLFEKPIPHVRS